MSATTDDRPARSFPRMNVDLSDALLPWLISLIKRESQDRLREIQNEILLIDGSAERPSVTFSRKTEPHIQILDGRLTFEFGSEEAVLKEGLGPLLSLLSTEERDQLMQAIIQANRAKASSK